MKTRKRELQTKKEEKTKQKLKCIKFIMISEYKFYKFCLISIYSLMFKIIINNNNYKHRYIIN
jgi:hypothetical protein